MAGRPIEGESGRRSLTMGDSSDLVTAGTVLIDGDQLAMLADGQCSIVRLDEQRSVLVFRSGERYLVYLNRCPHFGVELARQPEHLYLEAHQWFRCSVHYAKFRWHDGYCFSGDCEGDSLTPIAVGIKSGGLVVGSAG